MNLDDDLTPTADPAPLLRAMRRHRRMRAAVRTTFSATAVIALAIGLWPRVTHRPPALAATTPASFASPVASVLSATPEPPSVKMTRDELIDSLKDQTYALIRWPDGREQLLIRR